MSIVTRMDVTPQIRRLESAGYRVPRVGVDRVGEVWTEVMAGVPLRQLRDAVTRFLKIDERGYWPKPAQIRQLAIQAQAEDPKSVPTDLQSRYLRWERDQQGPCPVCRSTVELVSAERRAVPQRVWNADAGQVEDGPAGEDRYWVVHDAERHRQEGVPWVGPPYAALPSGSDE